MAVAESPRPRRRELQPAAEKAEEFFQTRTNPNYRLPLRSGDLHLHLADFVFDISEKRMLPKTAQIRVPGQPFEIAITQ